jgi:hypothetical protein
VGAVVHPCDLSYPSKANFVSEVVEAADTVLSVFEVVVLDEAETAGDVSDGGSVLREKLLTLCKDWSSGR